MEMAKGDELATVCIIVHISCSKEDRHTMSDSNLFHLPFAFPFKILFVFRIIRQIH